ncbi:hypothetical protein EVAR_98151_1 [Eumeta japonica]|uniref:Uncharacterized protein n=1 Tax=Eumeta variegata TaxID=151549 RepID=A0A4C1XQU2_EUMVA|nr:hypothetical protein EVAR_98151_1 [Eumeta japonica]
MYRVRSRFSSAARANRRLPRAPDFDELAGRRGHEVTAAMIDISTRYQYSFTNKVCMKGIALCICLFVRGIFGTAEQITIRLSREGRRAYWATFRGPTNMLGTYEPVRSDPPAVPPHGDELERTPPPRGTRKGRGGGEVSNLHLIRVPLACSPFVRQILYIRTLLPHIFHVRARDLKMPMRAFYHLKQINWPGRRSSRAAVARLRRHR